MAVLVSLPAMAAAGTAAWTTHGPYGGVVSGIAVDPTTPTTLYAGTVPAGVFKSTDGGVTWRAANTGLTDRSIVALAIDPVTPAVLYAGTRSGVFRSSDGGETWTAVNQRLGEFAVQALLVAATTPTTVYAGTAGGGIFKSVDGGATWSAANVGVTVMHISALAGDPTNGALVYAAGANLVFKSTDSGGSWSGAVLDTEGVFVALAIDPITPTTIYAAAPGVLGVLKSVDAGLTWAPMSPDSSYLAVHGLAMDPLVPATLYAATGSRGVLKSPDAGATWSPANAGLGRVAVSAVAASAVPGTVYAGTLGGVGLFKTTNAAGTWEAANTGLTAAPVAALASAATGSTVYAGTSSSGVFKQDERSGWNFAGLGNTPILAVAVDPTAPSTAYAGAEGGPDALGGSVFKTTDGGATWVPLRSGGGFHAHLAVAIDPVTPTTIYTVSKFAGIQKSTDGGATWRVLPANLKGGFSPFALAIDPVNPSTVYAASEGLVKTVDRGETWTTLVADTGLVGVATLAVDPGAPLAVYAGTSVGVFKTVDGGVTWSTALPDGAVTAVMLDPDVPRRVYAGLFGGGVYRSEDGGATWTPENSGLPDLEVRALAADATTLYAGTTAGGVAERLLPPVLAVDVTPAVARAGDRLQVGVKVRNPAPDGAADVFFAVIPPPTAEPALGCADGHAIAFLTPEGSALRCSSSSPAEFPPLLRALGLPLSLPLTGLPGLLNEAIPAGLPIGQYGVLLALTRVGATADGRLDPGDVLALATGSFRLTAD